MGELIIMWLTVVIILWVILGFLIMIVASRLESRS